MKESQFASRKGWRPEGTAIGGYAFLLPAIILIVMVSVYPILLTISYAFRETHYFNVGGFIGTDTFVRVVTSAAMREYLLVTAKYVLGSLLGVLIIAIPLAITLARSDRFTRAMQTVVLIPWVASQTVTALLWTWLLTPSLGPIETVVRGFFGSAPGFLSDPKWAIFSVIAANVWMSYPVTAVLLLAAVSGIPHELYEAASIDGAGWLKKFSHVTFPGIRNTLGIACVMASVLFVNMVTLIYTMTGGGPLYATQTIGMSIFQEGFTYSRLNSAAVYAIVALVINFVFATAYLRALSNDD